MSVDVFRKIAIGALAQIGNGTPAVLVLTGSRRDADCLPAARALASALAAVSGDAALEEPPGGEWTAARAREWVAACKAAHAVTVLPLPCLREDAAAMLLAAAAGNVLLLEGRELSRRDEIGDTLEIIRGLSARAVGFVLE